VAVTGLWLADFRCFAVAEMHPEPEGLTVLRGANGAGKTSLLEAVGWLATQRSIRGAPREALVRTGATRAVVRAETEISARRALFEAEIPVAGPGRLQVNRQPVRTRAEAATGLDVTVFSPDDLQLVQGGPAVRREYLDDVLATRHARCEALVAEVERILRQRAALLRQAGGRLDDTTGATLEVWDDRLARSGTALAAERAALAGELAAPAAAAYARLAGGEEPMTLRYRRSWEGDLVEALAAARRDDLRRQVTTVGPHRDDLDITVGPRPSRTHASQGEQRSAALALRLASHALRSAPAPGPPVLLLDDVFSELDAARAAALVELLPPGQVLLTTAVDPPASVRPDQVLEVVAGAVVSTVTGR